MTWKLHVSNSYAVGSSGSPRCGGSCNTGTSRDKVKPLEFDGSMSRAIFHHQFEAVASHNNWTSRDKFMHLLTLLQG